MEQNNEKILCAATWYKDFPTPKFNPINIEKGLVTCSYRHGACISKIKALTNLRTVTYAEDATGEFKQGFLTSENRFVDRQEAYKIAFEQNQIIGPNKGKPTNIIGLTSEDLY